jgi:hypothetical protein
MVALVLSISGGAPQALGVLGHAYAAAAKKAQAQKVEAGMTAGMIPIPEASRLRPPGRELRVVCSQNLFARVFNRLCQRPLQVNRHANEVSRGLQSTI